MPLPRADTKWPPPETVAVFNLYAEHAAWYSSNPEALANVYGGAVTTSQRPAWWKFWARAGTQTIEHQTRTQLHMPLAADIAATSASLLFGEVPTITIPGAHEENAPAGSVQAEDRLETIINEGDIEARLLEAADSCAALGGVYLKVTWDPVVLGIPILSVVQADNAVPEFAYGRLMAVNLFRTVAVDRQTVWRHLERHEPGWVVHALYRGRGDNLGERVSLEAHPETERLEDETRLPFDDLAIRYIPNMRPNRRFRGLDLGQSDYSGAEGMLDALDETWTSWMRDIRLGRARLLVPEEYLQNAGSGFSFDTDQEVFTPLEMSGADERRITSSQFDIRVEEHERTAMTLIEQIVSHAGYSPQTFGLHIEERAESGTALRVRERKTLSTQQKKGRMWPSPLADLLELMLVVDKTFFKSGITVFRPQVEMADSLIPDEMETATTVELLNRAGAISDEMKIRRVNPEWDEERVLAEVQRIREDSGLALPDAMQIGVA